MTKEKGSFPFLKNSMLKIEGRLEYNIKEEKEIPTKTPDELETLRFYFSKKLILSDEKNTDDYTTSPFKRRGYLNLICKLINFINI